MSEVVSQVVLGLVDAAPELAVLVVLGLWADKRVLPIVAATFDRQAEALQECQRRLDEVLDTLLVRSDRA